MQRCHHIVRTHLSPTRALSTAGGLFSAVRPFSSSPALKKQSMFETYGPIEVHAETPYFIASSPVGPFAMNQYFVACPETGDAAIIDAGLQSPKIFVNLAEKMNVVVKHIIQTHAHIDHVAGMTSTKEIFPSAPIYLHPLDGPLYEATPMQASRFGLESIAELPDWDIDLHSYHADTPKGVYDRDGKSLCGDISVGNTIRFKILHTPGHCPGHVCLHDNKAEVMFGGDLLFRHSVGRTDLFGSSPTDMQNSLSLVKQLPVQTRVFPGHGPPTSIGEEVLNNPFLQDATSVLKIVALGSPFLTIWHTMKRE
eukprot:CFRG5589T1